MKISTLSTFKKRIVSAETIRGSTVRAAFRGQLVKAENHYLILYFHLEISDVYNKKKHIKY